MTVAHTIGRAQQQAFHPARVGLLIAGLEVPHTHLHLIPIRSEADLHLSNAATSVDSRRAGAPCRGDPRRPARRRGPRRGRRVTTPR